MLICSFHTHRAQSSTEVHGHTLQQQLLLLLPHLLPKQGLFQVFSEVLTTLIALFDGKEGNSKYRELFWELLSGSLSIMGGHLEPAST